LLELALGEEGVEELLDDLAVALRELLYLAELLRQLRIVAWSLRDGAIG
jgi:hypothetical protein